MSNSNRTADEKNANNDDHDDGEGGQHANQEASGKDKPKTDDRLDFTSDQFDAQFALNAKLSASALPAPNAPIFDNLAMFASKAFSSDRSKEVVELSAEQQQRLEHKRRLQQVREQQSKSIVFDQVQKTYTQKLTLFDWMEKVTGPCSVLTSLFRQSIQVQIRRKRRVQTEGESQFAIIKGLLQMFDPHMNLILKQATEFVSAKIDNQTVQRQRQLGQIYLRGDQIVCVCAAKSD